MQPTAGPAANGRVCLQSGFLPVQAKYKASYSFLSTEKGPRINHLAIHCVLYLMAILCFYLSLQPTAISPLWICVMYQSTGFHFSYFAPPLRKKIVPCNNHGSVDAVLLFMLVSSV